MSNGWHQNARAQLAKEMSKRFHYISGSGWEFSVQGERNQILDVRTPNYREDDQFMGDFGQAIDAACVNEAGFELIVFEDPEGLRAYRPSAVAKDPSARPLQPGLQESEFRRLGR